MTDPQELANRIGAAQRATEAALDAGDVAGAKAHAAEQHQNLRDAFAFLRDEVGGELDLDWDQVAGNTGGTKGAVAHGGNPKDAPPSAE